MPGRGLAPVVWDQVDQELEQCTRLLFCRGCDHADAFLAVEFYVLWFTVNPPDRFTYVPLLRVSSTGRGGPAGAPPCAGFV